MPSVTLCQPSESDKKQVLELLLQTFVNKDPLNKSILLQNLSTTEQFRKSLNELTKDGLNSQFSVVAKIGNKVVGATVVDLLSTEEYLSKEIPYLKYHTQIMKQLIEGHFKDRINCSPFLHLTVSVVSDEYQRQGISGMMIDWVIDKAKGQQVSVIYSEATDSTVNVSSLSATSNAGTKSFMSNTKTRMANLYSNTQTPTKV